MELVLIILCGAAAAFFLARYIKKSLVEGEECSGCRSGKGCCSTRK